MKILGIDTATKVAGVAIVDETGVLAESWLNTGRLIPRLLPLLDNLLKNGDFHGMTYTAWLLPSDRGLYRLRIDWLVQD